MDKLHFLASLMDENPLVTFADSPDNKVHSMGEICLAIVEHIAKNPSPEHAIVAEQLYVRLSMIDSHLDPFFT